MVTMIIFIDILLQQIVFYRWRIRFDSISFCEVSNSVLVSIKINISFAKYHYYLYEWRTH